MCGIVGYVGEQDALEVVLGGLRRLEYRGYDSAGVAVLGPDGDLRTERRAGVRITDLDGTVVQGETYHVDWDTAAAEKGGHEFFMLKEIVEQPAAVRDTLGGRLTVDGLLHLDELSMSDEDVRDIEQVFIVACGSAYHSGLVGKYAIERWCRLPVQIEVASEFRYRDPVLGRHTL